MTLMKTLPLLVFSLFSFLHLAATPPGQFRIHLTSDNLKAEGDRIDWSGIIDSQLDLGNPPSAPHTGPGWRIAKHPAEFPAAVTIDLGKATPLAGLWIYDTNGKGDLLIQAGEPGKWKTLTVYDCGTYKQWVRIDLNVESRYLRLELPEGGANFSQIALDAYSPRGFETYQEGIRAAEREAAEKEERLRLAREEALRRPLIEMEPYGLLSLVDEVDVSGDGSEHLFTESPAGASRIETLLGRPARVLNKLENEVPVISYRIGQNKLLRAGGTYVVVVDYPEDQPRSMIISSTGNETNRGFHTGNTLGDAMHPKYVNNLNESVNLPLSGKWETWSLLTQLHDRFPEAGGLRGPKSRSLTPEDGFTVSITQFSKKNIPVSAGAAVSRIRLFEVVNPDQLAKPLALPPAGLPRRHISWREEMADGVIQSDKAEERGLENRIDWYRQKAERMHFLGINTYTKDLLEFGANQHWDSSEYGGNKWVYQGSSNHLWGEIVSLMGEEGFTVFPYYEYAGSKGQQGLGNQKRAKPLTRDDAYTHTKWIESSNADITDPDTYTDFAKMLDLTVLRHRDKAEFLGIWMRPRRQLPVGFGPATLARFSEEANRGVKITRKQLIDDKDLYNRYIAWWEEKRRDFLVAMRRHLMDGGLEDPLVLFTNNAAESGVSFTGLGTVFVADQPGVWRPLLTTPPYALPDDRSYNLLTPQTVAEKDLYLHSLTSPSGTWGGWEWQHSEPANDPEHYKTTEGLLLTYPFNRMYTVLSPKALESFSGEAGLAMVRHYSLNENMAYGPNDEPKLGYFVADIERAGRFCMQAEVVAMANGNPTFLGYLVGSNFGRGFPGPVREFNANFLALPALPSRILANATDDPEVVVRIIETEKHGRYISIAHTGTSAKENAIIRLPSGTWSEVISQKPVQTTDNAAGFNLKPIQLLTLHSP